jgi:hypothetical protein
MAPCAPNLRRPSCYADLRLPLLRRLRWVRPHWRRHRLRPGTAAAVGTAAGTVVVGIAAGAGVAPASSSAVRSITVEVTAAATFAGWFRPRGGPNGAWSTVAIDAAPDLNSSSFENRTPVARGRGFALLRARWNRTDAFIQYLPKRHVRYKIGNNLMLPDLIWCDHLV